MDIQTLGGGLGIEAHTIYGVPGVSLICDICGICATYTRLDGLIKGYVGGRDASGSKTALQLEVGTTGTKGGTSLWPVQFISPCHKEYRRVILRHFPIVVTAAEVHAGSLHVVILHLLNGDASEHRVHNVARSRIGLIIAHCPRPLDDIRCAGLKRINGVAEVHRQATAGIRRTAQRACLGTSQRTAGDGYIEGQADGVPLTVLIQRAMIMR